MDWFLRQRKKWKKVEWGSESIRGKNESQIDRREEKQYVNAE